MPPTAAQQGSHLAGALFVALVAHGLSVSLYSFFLRRRNGGGQHTQGAIVLRYPRAWHWFAWAMLIGPLAGIAWLCWKFPPKSSDLMPLLGLVALFGLPATWIVIQVSGVAHELQSGGLLRVTPWSPRQFLPWSEVSELRYSDLMTAWRVRTSAGDGAWIYLALSGIGAFARTALEQVRPQVIDRSPQTRQLLTDQAQRSRTSSRS